MKTKANKKSKEELLITILLFILFCTAIYSSDSFIYVIDTGNNRIQKFNIDGIFLLTFGSKGTADGLFNYPAGIAISSDINLIYVGDTANNRVQVFDKNGNFIKIFPTQPLSNPNSITINNEQGKDFLYIADTGHNIILKYSQNGEFVYTLGKLQAGNKDGEFNNPQGITANKDFIFVSDTGNHRIQKFDLNGNFLLKWGSQGKETGKFNYPRDIAVDDKGHVYVVDSQNFRVQKFTADGEFILEWGKKGTADGEFNNHFGIAVDEKNFIYVADAGNNRVQKFTEDGTWLKTYGTIDKSAEPGLFYYPQGIEIGYLKVFSAETPALTFTSTDTETFTFTPTEIFTLTPTHTEIQTQSFTEIETPVSEITPVEYPGQCEFIKVYEIKWSFLIPRAITLDKKENIYILDFFSRGILKFNKNGCFIKKINCPPNNVQEDSIENVEYEIEVLERGETAEEISDNSEEEKFNITIMDYSNDEIKRINTEGKVLEKFNAKISDEKNIGNFIYNNRKFYLANGYKGEIKIFDNSGKLLKIIKNLKRMLFLSKIIIDDDGAIYLIDRKNGKIYRIIKDTNINEVYNFNFKYMFRYLYFIKNNYLYIVEMNRNKMIIYKLACQYDPKPAEEKDKVKNSDYGILMYDKNKTIVKNNDLDEREVYNYPNPCNGITTIRFITYRKQDVLIVIYNINGGLVWQKKINAEEIKYGLNEIIFNGKNEYGIDIDNGVYLYKIITQDKVITKKIVIMK